MQKSLKDIIASTILSGAMIVLPACSTKTVKDNSPKCEADAVEAYDLLKELGANSPDFSLKNTSYKLEQGLYDDKHMKCFMDKLRTLLGDKYTVGCGQYGEDWKCEVTLKSQ